jgi:signal transduction histidine kinase/ActR/RegA family two-component response regulator
MIDHWKEFLSMQKITTKEKVNLSLAIKPNPLLVEKNTMVSQVLQLMKSDQNICGINDNIGILSENNSNGHTLNGHQEETRKSNNRPDCVLVMENMELIGIFTVRDAIKLIAQGNDLTQTSISQVMNTPVFSIKESEITSIFALTNLMQQRHIRHLPILDANYQLVGLVTHESLRCLVQPFDLLRLRSVREVMNIDVVKADASTYILELSRLMIAKRVSCVVLTETVMFNDNCVDQPVGIVTEGDIVEWQAMGINLVDLQAYQMMKEPICTMRLHNTLLEAHHLMDQYDLQRLLVVGENQELLGILTQTTILQAIDPWEIYNLAETLQLKLTAMQNEQVEILAHRNTLLEAEIEKRKILEGKLQEKVTEHQQSEIEVRETNKQLIVANEELAKVSQLKSEFLANMSHELRTPLNSILGLSQVLQEEVFGELNNKQQKSLQTIYNNGQHLLELINDILELAKIESGKLELHQENVSILSLCQNSLSIVKSHATQKNIQLHLLVADHSLQVNVDERRMRQVLINLLSNAIKFTPDHGTVTLQVGPQYEAQPLLLKVIDTGIGISPEDQGKLFQAFVQIDSKLSRSYEGTGLGLVLVKQIVEMHGGTVTLTSKLGEGSCFTISLPWQLSKRSPQKAVSLVEQTVNPMTVNSSKKPLILLAEDNESNIETILEYLEIKGYEILLASNGLQAVELAHSHQPQLILMDIQMPEMDGIEATKTIRQDLAVSHIPIIALTALTMPEDMEKCLEAGVNGYLSKPFRLQKLVETIQEHILAK